MFTKLEAATQTLIEGRAVLFVLLTNPVVTRVSGVLGKLEVLLQALTVSLTASLVTGKLKSGLVKESLMTEAGSPVR